MGSKFHKFFLFTVKKNMEFLKYHAYEYIRL